MRRRPTPTARGGSIPDDLDAATLRRLEERLDRAAAAAERLLADAVPESGWQRRLTDGERTRLGGWLSDEDAELLAALLTGLRDRIPAELQQRLAAAIHEVLLALRALIDWYLERSERRRATPTEVQDIPIL